jgi:beta-xylosidase
MGNAGEPVLESELPARALGAASERPCRDDDFSSTELSLQWHWQANPADHWLELRGDGKARLTAVPNDVGSLRSIPQVLGQQLPGQPVEFSTSLSMDATTPGLRAGVTVLGGTYAWIGILVDQHGAARIVAGQSDGGGETRTDLGAVANGERLALRVRSDGNGVCARAFARADGDPDLWVDGVTNFRATPGHWISAELGLFAASGPGSATVSAAAFGPAIFTDR